MKKPHYIIMFDFNNNPLIFSDSFIDLVNKPDMNETSKRIIIMCFKSSYQNVNL